MSTISPMVRAKAAKGARFFISGGTAAAVNLGLLYMLTEFFDIWYIFSEISAFSTAVVVSFCLQKFWTFNDRSLHMIRRQALVFASITIVNLALNTGLLFLFTETFGIYYVWSQILAGALIAVESYFAYRKFVFKEHFPMGFTRAVPEQVIAERT
jgi:putative flippase GtrA